MRSRCSAYGAASGYGFYQAKKQVAAGHTFSGVLLANLSASVIDNVTSGEGPLSYLGFTLPLVRLEIATPLARHNRSLLRFTVSPRDAISLAMAFSKSDRVSLRGGMLAFEADTPLAAGVRGWAYSIFPTVVSGKPESVFRHEMVHVVQSLQLMAASPEPLVNELPARNGQGQAAGFRRRAPAGDRPGQRSDPGQVPVVRPLLERGRGLRPGRLRVTPPRAVGGNHETDADS